MWKKTLEKVKKKGGGGNLRSANVAVLSYLIFCVWDLPLSG